jgi:hypothetical protein
MIQDEAIKCRYCHSDLTVLPGAKAETGPEAAATETSAAGSATSEPSESPAGSVETAPETPVDEGTELETGGDTTAEPAGETTGEPTAESTTSSAEPSAATGGDVRYTHSGFRYVLGYSADSFGIWDRQSPAQPSERFPRTDDGWRQAWLRFVALEPNNTVVESGHTAAGATTPAGGAPMDPDDVAAVQYTHSGTRYLLGYGRTFFGIWDRQAPAEPVEKFPRDDAGWAAAWGRFTQIESNFSEVGLGD